MGARDVPYRTRDCGWINTRDYQKEDRLDKIWKESTSPWPRRKGNVRLQEMWRSRLSDVRFPFNRQERED